MTEVEAGNVQTDFWTWAVRIYAAPEVQERCLSLQDDHDQCVPLLLWAAWMACEGRMVHPPLAARGAAVARTWSGEVVAPLRTVRRRLKVSVSDDDSAVRLPLRETLKAVELEAEKAMMTCLEKLAQAESARKSQDVYAALLTVAEAWSCPPPRNALEALARALTID